jgi:cytochrome P450
MQSFVYHILKSPAIYNNILSEIDAAQSVGNLSSMITYAEAQALPYFQAALKEAMRVRPAVGLNITRHVPPSGAEIDGQWYPGDTRVALNAWVLHKDKGVFGEDADVYRPERWLEGGEAKAKAMDRHMYQVSPISLRQVLVIPVNADDCV